MRAPSNEMPEVLLVAEIRLSLPKLSVACCPKVLTEMSSIVSAAAAPQANPLQRAKAVLIHVKRARRIFPPKIVE